MPEKHHPSRKKFTRFSSKLPFQFGLPNVSPGLTQASDGSPTYLTRTTSLLRRQILANAASVKIISDDIFPDVLKRNAWNDTAFDNKRILFLIPDDAIGDCVGMALFLRAFCTKYPLAKIAVLNSGSASDIFATLPDIKVFQLFISSKRLRTFDYLIDLSEMAGWKDIATMPVNPEAALCETFGIDPIPLNSQRQPKLAPGMKIGILPMASSPLRTLPPSLVRKLAKTLAASGYKTTLILNAYQGVMKKYKDALGPFDDQNIKIIDGFKTIGDLVSFIENQDYVIVADSGPAHITKLFQTPGIGIYTSASASTLQGRHQNLLTWQSTYKGDFCEAPCGLAKLRATADGKIGCMGSLGLSADKLSNLPQTHDKALAERLVTEAPVPCVAELTQQTPDFLTYLAHDLGI
ncbi:glycosyltransferase family 9 protein [Thalassospira alkalitolerans]|uniref:glycosyltransferase family 9 protein n=1 Tax=Thalassospira alkalitolerans TaxID=1293890 RepID=UPI0030EB604C|tara:strand:+ start:17242 stop:18462 length:1221 start_codon:yes stop_codon:yes gene_type:complete